MIVASLIATIAFQVEANPPGGVWVDDSAEHQAGKAILAYKYPHSYPIFTAVNTFGFLFSLTLIILFIAAMRGPTRFDRLARPVFAWFTLMPMAFAYTYSIIATFPEAKVLTTKNTSQVDTSSNSASAS
ncbi:hypothetical protein Vadar_023449 [Vaccinium darrowii]|uniref:Uncharacterized protein n=1 Tax=Vaccinium darrowii TaxID=229202 RepID=A0ACB7X3R3_9ERIC|nr:hypothetical protein Vadar_023449 [Vaccinium darrowii]